MDKYHVNLLLVACILFLEGLLVGAVLSKVFFVFWNRRWRGLGKAVFQGLQRLWKTRGDPEVDKKFQKVQCTLVVTGSQVFLLALYPRMFAVQGSLWRNESHSIFPAMDHACVISAFVCVTTIFCREHITSKVLDLWFVVMVSTCIMPLLVAHPDDVRMLSFVAILPAFIISLCAKHATLVVIAAVINSCIIANRSSEKSMSDLISVIAMSLLSLSATLTLRSQIYQNVQVSLRLKHRSIDLEAVSALLLGMCDAVVETDEELRLTDDSRQLSTLLLQGQGCRDLAGRNILSFFDPEDQDRIRHSLQSTMGTQTTALNARMLDSLGNLVRVELLHVRFSHCDTKQYHLIGMREFQDVNSVVPLMEEDADPDLALREVLRKADSSLVFDAATFDILTVSPGFQQLCSKSGQGSLDGLSIFEVCTSTGPQSFTCRMQDAVNAADDTASCQDIMLLRKVELCGQEVDVAVSFQHDSLLNSLVGNVVIVHSSALQSELLRVQGLGSLSLGSRPGSPAAGRRQRSPTLHGTTRGTSSL